MKAIGFRSFKENISYVILEVNKLNLKLSNMITLKYQKIYLIVILKPIHG